MSKQPAKVINISLGGVALEGYTKNFGMDVTQETPNVTAISDAGPRVVVGNYDWKASLDGDADFGAGASDATIFGFVGSTAVHAMAFQPAGTTETADTPNYDATDLVLSNYSIRAAVGGAVTYASGYQGNSALSRLTT